MLILDMHKSTAILRKFSLPLQILIQNRWDMHGTILKSLQKQAKHIHAWWEFTGRPDPGEDGVVESLKRLVSGVLTHPITIGIYHSCTIRIWSF